MNWTFKWTLRLRNAEFLFPYLISFLTQTNFFKKMYLKFCRVPTVWLVCPTVVSSEYQVSIIILSSNIFDQPGKVRACTSGDDDVYYVYNLVNIPTSCQWAYCAVTTHKGPTWKVIYLIISRSKGSQNHDKKFRSKKMLEKCLNNDWIN